MDHDQQAGIEWRGAVPISTQFGDPYFAFEDGLAETRHVFLAGDGLPQRYQPGFHIAELGFGTGLNCLAAWASWCASGTRGALRYTSFEAFPMRRADMVQALDVYRDVLDVEALLETWPACGIRTETLCLDVVICDARDTLPAWHGLAAAWFLDGFAPARNPELWEPDLLAEVARHTAPKGTFATYTAAGAVRRALADVGFNVTRQTGYGQTRNMSTGTLG